METKASGHYFASLKLFVLGLFYVILILSNALCCQADIFSIEDRNLSLLLFQIQQVLYQSGPGYFCVARARAQTKGKKDLEYIQEVLKLSEKVSCTIEVLFGGFLC